MAHLLAPRFRRIHIAAAQNYAHLVKWRSHPLLDPLWSTEECEIVHDGCEATRIDKVRRIATHPTLLRGLRVCWQRIGGGLNCGRCEKCVRTMLALEAVGRLSDCASFPVALTPMIVLRAMRVDPGVNDMHALDILRALDPKRSRGLRVALRLAFVVSPIRRFVARLRRRLRLGSRAKEALKLIGIEGGAA